VDALREMSFVFLCMEGTAKQFIVEKLEEFGLPFIDVGMGVYLSEGSLGGILRVTTSTPAQRDHLRKRVSFANDAERNEYATNIQIADLNALNAALAVIKWKKLAGFIRISTLSITAPIRSGAICCATKMCRQLPLDRS
jgi:hypothetical protein